MSVLHPSQPNQDGVGRRSLRFLFRSHRQKMMQWKEISSWEKPFMCMVLTLVGASLGHEQVPVISPCTTPTQVCRKSSGTSSRHGGGGPSTHSAAWQGAVVTAATHRGQSPKGARHLPERCCSTTDPCDMGRSHPSSRSHRPLLQPGTVSLLVHPVQTCTATCVSSVPRFPQKQKEICIFQSPGGWR